MYKTSVTDRIFGVIFGVTVKYFFCILVSVCERKIYS